MAIKIFIILFVVVIAIKFFKNAINLLSLFKYKNLFKKRIDILAKNPSGQCNDIEIKIFEKVQESKLQVIELFKRAGLKDFLISINVPVGYGQMQLREISFFDNLTSLRSTIDGNNFCLTTKEYINNGIGVYKSRMLGSLNPFYWVDLFLYLPHKIFLYLGVQDDKDNIKLIIKIVHMIWWCIELA